LILSNYARAYSPLILVPDGGGNAHRERSQVPLGRGTCRCADPPFTLQRMDSLHTRAGNWTSHVCLAKDAMRKLDDGSFQPPLSRFGSFQQGDTCVGSAEFPLSRPLVAGTRFVRRYVCYRKIGTMKDRNRIGGTNTRCPTVIQINEQQAQIKRSEENPRTGRRFKKVPGSRGVREPGFFVPRSRFSHHFSSSFPDLGSHNRVLGPLRFFVVISSAKADFVGAWSVLEPPRCAPPPAIGGQHAAVGVCGELLGSRCGTTFASA